MRTILLVSIFLLFKSPVNAQKGELSKISNWTVDAYDTWFIEAPTDRSFNNEKVRFVSFTEFGDVFFTNSSIYFVRYIRDYDEPKADSKELETEQRFEEMLEQKHKEVFHQIQFTDALESSHIEGNILEQHYTVFEKEKSSHYRELIYKNLYKNIDVKFTLPEEGGLKYDIIIHAGGNIHDLKMMHSGDLLALANNDDIRINDGLFRLSDAAPKANYSVQGGDIPIEYRLDGNTVLFDMQDYDTTQEIIIDPWIQLVPQWDTTYTSPMVGIPLQAFLDPFFKDINYDDEGSVYATRNTGTSLDAYQKYDSNGNLVWSSTLSGSNFPGCLSDASINPQTKTSYVIVAISSIAVIDSLGFMTNNLYRNPNGQTSDMYGETWTVRYDPCYDTLVVGGGFCLPGTPWAGGAPLVNSIDYSFWSNDLTTLTEIDGFPCLFDYQEMNVMTLDDEGGSIYAVLSIQGSSATAATGVDGMLMRIDYDTPGAGNAPVWMVPTQDYRFIESENVEALAVSKDFLYSYTGTNLMKWDKLNGNLINSVILTSPFPHLTNTVSGWVTWGYSSDFGFTGIDVDLCGNVYIGRDDEVLSYDADLNLLGSVAVAADTVIDIQINRDNMYVGGIHVLQSLSISQALNTSFLTLSQTPDSCDLCIGTASLDTSMLCNDFGSLQILWSNGQTTPTISGLCEGWYSVTVSGGCYRSHIDSIYVAGSQNNCAFSIGAFNDTICQGECVDLIVTNNSPVGPVTYSWDNGITATNDSVNICPTVTTSYQVIGNDGFTSDTATFIIEVVNPPLVDLGQDTTLCSGEQLSLDAMSPGNNVLWQDGSMNQFFQVTGDGTFSVTVGNAGCSVTDSIQVDFITINVNLGNDTILCAGENLNLNADPQYADYLWNTGEVTSQILVDTSGMYVVTVSQAGCEEFDSIYVEFELVQASFNFEDSIECDGNVFHFYDNSFTNIEFWTWDFGDGNNSNQADVSHTYLSSSVYDVSLEVESINGCVDDTVITITSVFNQTPSAAFSVSMNPAEVGELLSFNNQSINATHWDWNFGDGENSILENPTHNYFTEGSFTITLVASNEGCLDTFQLNLIIQAPLIFYVPNSFTPNGDESNQNFMPVLTSGVDVNDYHLLIYNRWGQLIFESRDVLIGWDGTYDVNSNAVVQSGVYTWIIEFGNAYTGERHKVNGHVTLIK